MINMYLLAAIEFLSMARLKTAGALAGVALMAASPAGVTWAAGAAPPSTFGSIIGPALLCADQIDPFYFWSYLNQFYGPPYKAEGGAYWFKVKGTLWGAAITDVMVSDGSNDLVFLAASFKDKPAKLSDAIAGTTGIRHVNEELSQYSPLVSNLGSKIIYFGQKSKIYCAKYNLDYLRSRSR